MLAVVTGLALPGALSFAACGDDGPAEATPAGTNVATSGPSSLPSLQVRLEQGATTATVAIEVAATTEERERGLMFRESLAEDAGMLFLFPQDVRTGFWMRNTKVPLDIAYIGADGRVQEIRAAKPLDETVLTPAAPYRYVLEVNQGWFQRHNLGIGARVSLPAGLPEAR